MRILTFFAVTLFSISVAAQTCIDGAREVKPTLSAESLTKLTRDADAAGRTAEASPTADNIIWRARRQGYLGNYKKAISILTEGLKKFPADARMLRHRGHRAITVRCFDDAIRDLEKAAKLVKGKPDEIEPDGMPNEKNIPTSTLQSNIWYHLGLAYYLRGDMKKAVAAYAEALKVSKNNDMLAATTHWYYMALKRSGRHIEAERLLVPIDGEFEVIENADYLKLLRLYRGEVPPQMLAEALGEKATTLGNASLGYGLGNWHLYNGRTAEAMSTFRKIAAGDQWASFGYIAADAELSRRN